MKSRCKGHDGRGALTVVDGPGGRPACGVGGVGVWARLERGQVGVKGQVERRVVALEGGGVQVDGGLRARGRGVLGVRI